MLFKRNKPVLPDNTPKMPLGIRITGGLMFIAELVASRVLEERYGWLVVLALTLLVSILLFIACLIGKEDSKQYSMFIMWRNVTFAVTAIYVAKLMYWAFIVLTAPPLKLAE